MKQSFILFLPIVFCDHSSFLDIPLSDLCQSEPHLEICRGTHSSHHSNPSHHPIHNPIRDRVYPGLTPKDSSYCNRMRSSFAWTCQPSKSLRVDLVEFCKDYSSICHIPNFHRLPGPRLGGINPKGFGYGYDNSGGPGRVDVEGNFNFGIGAVPGLEVDAGWGVDVGPIPGMGNDVGVNTNLGLGIMGASQPELYRRGHGEGRNGGGLVGIGGGVGVG